MVVGQTRPLLCRGAACCAQRRPEVASTGRRPAPRGSRVLVGWVVRRQATEPGTLVAGQILSRLLRHDRSLVRGSRFAPGECVREQETEPGTQFFIQVLLFEAV